jgi:peptidoglycan hydrolase CwlO-like protein
LNKLRDERTALYEKQKEKWQAIQKLKDDYYHARNAFRDYEKEAWRIRREKKAKEEEEYRQAKKRQIAQQKMGMCAPPRM